MNNNVGELPFVQIIEQPSGSQSRFRRKCKTPCDIEGLPGINNTEDHKTFPAIQVNKIFNF